jgi:hypothetical protein
MKLDAGEIKDLVEETERKRANWAQAAEVWEKDWSLVRYDDSPNDIKDLDGVSSIVSPDPFNIVQLLQRFVAEEERVEIPSLSVKEDDEDRSEVMEEFTVAFERESSRQQGRNLIQDKTWMSGVRGCGASQTLWIEDDLPKGMKGKRLPILKRNLDPMNVGIARGPYWTDYAYHSYEASRSYIEQAYPDYELPDNKTSLVKHGYYNEKYKVIDFWCMHSGSVMHGVVIDGKFAMSLVKTDYPDIPIVMWSADGAPIDDFLAQNLSILHPIHELWEMKCNLMSKIATGLDYHYDPLMMAWNFGANDRVKAGPGEIIYLTGDQKLEAFRAEPNVPMAEKMLALIQTGIDQATFPGVLHGEAPGGVQAGFALNSLAQQARSRANIIRGNIEGAMESENQLLYGLIEAFSGEKGVQIYGRSSRNDRGRPIRLSAEHIKGNYDNRVMLVPEQPMDDNARIMAWLQMTEKGVTSMNLMRNRVLNVAIPRDEELRIAYEQALKQPNMQLKVQLRALQHSLPQHEWERNIVGTELEAVHQAEMQWQEQKEQEEEAKKEARRQEKMQREQEAMMQAQQEAMMNMPPMPMGDPSMMGMPPNLPPGGPMPAGFPMPQEPMGQPGFTGDPMGMQPPGLEAMPPQLAGQMSPDELGIPPGAPPGTFDALMGRTGPSEEEILRRLMGGAQPPM